MTEEEKLAIEIVNNLDTEIYDCEGSCVSIYDHMESACLAGIKAGKPKWHDLRENPDDLPPNENCDHSITVINQCGYNVRYDFTFDYWYFLNGDKADVVAWCELPKFEEDNRGK